MARDPLRRQQSRQAQNERRKIERRIKAIQRELETENLTEGMRKASESQIASLTKVKEALTSTVKKGEKKPSYAGDIEKIGKTVEAFTQTRFEESSPFRRLTKFQKEIQSKQSKQERQFAKNKVFERSLNQATFKNGLSAFNRIDVKSFYAVTQDIWQSVSNNSNKNKAIMDKFGLSDLETVYKLLTSKELKKEDFGFNDEETFQAWLSDLDSKVNLSLRRNIFDEAVRPKNFSTTDDDGFNEPDEKDRETSPIETVMIANSIASALHNGLL